MEDGTVIDLSIIEALLTTVIENQGTIITMLYVAFIFLACYIAYKGIKTIF